MATHSSIPVWEIPWIEEPGGLQFTGLQRVRLDSLAGRHDPLLTPGNPKASGRAVPGRGHLRRTLFWVACGILVP